MKKNLFDDELTMLWCKHVSEKNMPRLEEVIDHIAEPPVPASLKFSLFQRLREHRQNPVSIKRAFIVPAFTLLLAAFVFIIRMHNRDALLSRETSSFLQQSIDDDAQLVLNDDLFFEDPFIDMEDNV